MQEVLESPRLPYEHSRVVHWGQLYGSAPALALAQAARAGRVLLVLAPTPREAEGLLDEVRFFGGAALETQLFPDLETLPYDAFSAHPDITSARLSMLARLPRATQGVYIASIDALLQRLPPRSYLESRAFDLHVGERLDLNAFRAQLSAGGYASVTQVAAHGEFALRGSLVDVFPMGSELPFRIDLLDEDVEAIRYFDVETQRSREAVEFIHLLPARETPLDTQSVREFRRRYRARFSGDLQDHAVYREVSNGNAPGGIEYFLPLFFERTSNLFEYLPSRSVIVNFAAALNAVPRDLDSMRARHEQLAHDRHRPILEPAEVFLTQRELDEAIAVLPRVELQAFEWPPETPGVVQNFSSAAPAQLHIDPRGEAPAKPLAAHLHDAGERRTLLVAESAGRRELLLELLRSADLHADVCSGFDDFMRGTTLGVAVSSAAPALRLSSPPLEVLSEAQIFGERVRQERRRRRAERDPAKLLQELTDLNLGSPVVHESYGVGRYRGLVTMEIAGYPGEFLVLEYADADKLYVPVQSLHWVSRYTGAPAESAPLHKLGSDQWAKARRKAAQRIRDVAAELLDLYSRRAAREGASLTASDAEYRAFRAAFPFEETVDQSAAIEQVLDDLRASRPMDRVICGDVGFGKTEVALRAAFVAVSAGKQVAVLVPTTLLAQQHANSFADRFADWPVRIETLSRFRTGKESQAALNGIAQGSVDILIATQKLLHSAAKFKNLGLIIVDEEHRFGVRDKEKLKALRAEVDVLTLTATPIPRTLNMAMGGLRDLSLITTPPAERVSVKTFVTEWNEQIVREACQRELRRGGQIYYVHNAIDSIEKTANVVRGLLPSAQVRVGHGQMRERDLESLMLDFYHRRFDVLVCTTIIESGIDVPTANTIVIDRADRFGLAQLHQLRGRVGRSHHRAYAYLITPPRNAMTGDAVKRLEALESLEDLGAGFVLATHDLEIRGAGELLGDEQSGQIHEIGFSLYTELLNRAVAALKEGKSADLEAPPDAGTELELPLPALIPEDYVSDVHLRLVLYKRIASLPSDVELDELRVELIDRFGPLPAPAQTLFRAAQIKLRAATLGIRKIHLGASSGYVSFDAQHRADAAKVLRLVQSKPKEYRLEGESKLRFAHAAASADAMFAKLRQLLESIA